MSSIPQPIFEMALLLSPATLSVQIADQITKAIASRTAATLQGNFKGGLFQKSTSYREIFFPRYSKKPFEDRLTDVGFNNFSIALLCASIKRHASSVLRSQMNQTKINAAVNSFNARLTPTIPQVYAVAITTKWPDFARLYNAVRGDLAAARVHYRQALINAAANHALWFASGQWKSPDYECFHHWVKYMALGASPADVDDLIADVKLEGFPIPAVVDVDSWRTFTGYGYSPISHKDIDGQVRGPITESIYISNIYGGTNLQSAYALDFTANEQPGNPYRDPPSGGSCFDKGALVLMADKRTLRPVESLRPGDKIWSPAAKAPVAIALIAHPSVSGRALHTLNGNKSFRFTDTHPFLVHEDSGSSVHIACADPEKLGRYSPTWSDLGTVSLSNSSVRLIQVKLQKNGTLLESGLRADVDTAVARVEGDTFADWARAVKNNRESHGILYDIILEKTELCDGDIPVDYVAGAKDMLVRVGSELPPLAAADPKIVMIVKSVIAGVSQISKPLDDKLDTEKSAGDHWDRQAVIREKLGDVEGLLRGNWLQAALSVAAEGRGQARAQGSAKGERVGGLGGENESLGLSDIGSAFYGNGSANVKATQSQGFRSAMAYLYDQFIRAQTVELRAYLELGFRTIPRLVGEDVKVKKDSVVAVSVWGVRIRSEKVGGAGDWRKAKVADLSVSVGADCEQLGAVLEGVEVAVVGSVQSAKARYWAVPKQRIWYYGVSGTCAVGETEFSGRVEASVVGGGRERMVGDASVHMAGRDGYSPATISLAANGDDREKEENVYEVKPAQAHEEVAEMWVDVRLLSGEQAEAEIGRAKRGWTAEMASEKARELAGAAGEAYVRVVSDAVESASL